MDKYELEYRAGIKLTDEEYAMIETVYLESEDFLEVGDVVKYIKDHRGSYKGILDQYKLACQYATLRSAFRGLENETARLRAEVARLQAIVEVYRPFVDPQKILESAGIDNVAAMLGQKEVA